MLIAELFSGVVIVLKNMAGNRKSTQKSRNYFQELLKLLNDKCAFKSKTIKWQKGAEMERLTIDEIIEHCGRKAGMYEKVCDVKYLETAVMGNGIKEYWEHKQVAEYLRKFKDYEDLEEQGRLIKLPCKVGDKIFLDFAGFGKDVDKFTVKDFHLDCFKNGETTLFCDYESSDRTLSGQIDVMEFGKTVFITKSEAEAKLKELRGEENDR